MTYFASHLEGCSPEKLCLKCQLWKRLEEKLGDVEAKEIGEMIQKCLDQVPVCR